jgi:hypothetical protein
MNRHLLIFSPLFSALVAALLAGCAGDVAQPYELDHARVLAVRVEPAALAPGETGTVTVLFTDSRAEPRVASPEGLTLRLAEPFARPEWQALLQPTSRGWQVRAPDASNLRAIRASLALADDVPLVVPLTIDVATQDGTLRAQKLLAVGTTATNPAAPALRDASGNPLTQLEISAGVEVGLSTEATPGLEVRWFSSLGELRRYTQAESSIKAAADERGAAGSLMVVVRDQAGGVSWNLVPLQVTN